MIPMTIGTLGAVSKNPGQHLENLHIDKISSCQLQKATLLGSAMYSPEYISHNCTRIKPGRIIP